MKQLSAASISVAPRRARATLALFLTVIVCFAATPRASWAQDSQTTTRPRQTTASPQHTLPLPPPPPPPVLRKPAQPTPTPSEQQSATSDSAQDPGEEVGEGEILNVDTSLINLQVRVIDRQGRLVNDVRKEDFRIFEDGVPQEVAFFTTEEVPVSYGLAIDTSFSLRNQIDRVIEASKSIVESNKPGDETFVISFQSNKSIELLQDFTSDKEALTEKLDELFVRAGQTAVLDAVYLAAEHAASYRRTNESDVRRRALILVTDGEDKDSAYRQEQLFAFLREQGVQIYVIGFTNELEAEGNFIRKSPKDKAVNLINRLAKETGGRAFFPQSLEELPKIADEITRDLRTQFVIGYQPTNKQRDGRFRSVRVAVADAPDKSKRIALTRSGYTPGATDQPATGAAPAKAKPTINVRPGN